MAILRSNSGEEEIEIEPFEKGDFENERCLLCSVGLRGSNSDGDHNYPLEVSFKGLWLREETLRNLQERILAWAALPFKELAAGKLAATFELAPFPQQRAEVRIGRSLTSRPENSIVGVMLSIGQITLSSHIEADPSCLMIFAHELRRSMKGFS